MAHDFVNADRNVFYDLCQGRVASYGRAYLQAIDNGTDRWCWVSKAENLSRGVEIVKAALAKDLKRTADIIAYLVEFHELQAAVLVPFTVVPFQVIIGGGGTSIHNQTTGKQVVGGANDSGADFFHLTSTQASQLPAVLAAGPATGVISAYEIALNTYKCSPALAAKPISALRWLHLDGTVTTVAGSYGLSYLFVTNRPLDGATLAYLDSNSAVVSVPSIRPHYIELALTATPPMLASADPPVVRWAEYAIVGNWNATGANTTVYVPGLTDRRWASLGWVLDSSGNPQTVTVDVAGGTYAVLPTGGGVWEFLGNSADRNIAVVGQSGCIYGGDHYRNAYRQEHAGNAYGSNHRDNAYGADHTGNTYGNDHSPNTYGAAHAGNTYGDGHQKNTYGDGHGNNTYGDGHGNNTYGSDHNHNTYDDSCTQLIVGSGCSYLQVGANCQRVRIYNCNGTSGNPFIIPVGTVDAEYRNNQLVRYYNYRGAWAANTAYKPLDSVTNGGSTYYATTAFTSSTTFNASNWTNFAGTGGGGGTPGGSNGQHQYNNSGAFAGSNTYQDDPLTTVVRAADNSGVGVVHRVENTDTGGVSLAMYQMRTAGSNDGVFFGGKNPIPAYGIVNGATFRAGSATQDIGFSVGAATTGGANGPNIILKANGNVGFDTPLPVEKLDVNGRIHLSPVSAPATPATGFTIYCDSADGKLKAKGTSGAVTVLANP